jgi:predicted nucleic acid-binding protein
VILVDTGPIVAAALTGDRHHRACVDLFTAAHLARQPLAVPAPVVTEACYLLAREAGSRAEAAFLTSLADGDMEVVDLERDDWRRAADLVVRYRDLPLGAVDACVVAVAERLGLAEIATIDRRHFSVVRPRHVVGFTLLPDP